MSCQYYVILGAICMSDKSNVVQRLSVQMAANENDIKQIGLTVLCAL
jgi:hypothetical protein